jgi:hypothetical protein
MCGFVWRVVLCFVPCVAFPVFETFETKGVVAGEVGQIDSVGFRVVGWFGLAGSAGSGPVDVADSIDLANPATWVLLSGLVNR